MNYLRLPSTVTAFSFKNSLLQQTRGSALNASRTRTMATAAQEKLPVTLYVNKHCPYSHRVWWALEHTGANYQRFIISPSARPSWYFSKVTHTGKVPIIAYGGPETPPDQPSDESVKIPESGILLEFLADIFPEGKLLPKDPILRAKARLFIDIAANQFIPQYLSFLMRDGSYDDMLIGLEALQEMLPIEGRGDWVLGHDVSIADMAVAPFFPRMELAFENDLGAFEEGQGRMVYDLLRNDPRYRRYREYVDAVRKNEAFQRSFDIEHIKGFFTERLMALRAARKAAKGIA